MVDRSAIFSHGATFPNYVGYVRKVCRFLEEPLFRDTDALKNAIASLKQQGAGKYRFPHCIRSDIAVKILSYESRGSIFAHLCYTSFLFALRVPSEALHLRLDYRGDDLEPPPARTIGPSLRFAGPPTPRRPFAWLAGRTWRMAASFRDNDSARSPMPKINAFGRPTRSGPQ